MIAHSFWGGGVIKSKCFYLPLLVACCHGYCTSQSSDLAQLAPTSEGLNISPYVQMLTLHWITLSTLLMMAHKAETAVQGWSVDPMEDVILTRVHARPLAQAIASSLSGCTSFFSHADLKCALSRCSWLPPAVFARADYANQDWFPCIARRHRSFVC